MPDHRKLLLVCVLIFTALLFFNFFVVHGFFPEEVPGIAKAISGLFLLVCFEVFFYVVFKRILKQQETLSVAYLITFGCLIVLFGGIILQTYRLTTLEYATNEERIRIFLIGVLGLTAFAGIIALPVAVDVKYKKRWLTILLNVGIGVFFLLAVPYLFSLLRGE